MQKQNNQQQYHKFYGMFCNFCCLLAFQAPGSNEGQGSQNRPVDSGRIVGPSAILEEYPSKCWYYL